MIKALAKGMEILTILERKGSATITELADEIGVDKSTVSRLVATLKKYDMVRCDPANKQYRLGFRILHLGDGVRRHIDVASIARPYLYKITEAIGESVHLAAANNGKSYVIDQVRSKREYDLPAQVGMIESWHSSSVGKCVLAYKPHAYIERVLAEHGMKKYTEKTITGMAKLYAELDLIRKMGYAFDDEECTLGVRCVAVPIFNYNGQVNHSIGVSGPKTQMTQSRIEAFLPKMMECGKQISEELGCNRFGK